MKTVTIKSSCNGDEQTRTVTFLRDGLPVATVEVTYFHGFEWAVEYACDWCSYGKLPKVSTPVDIAPLPEPPAEIYLPADLTPTQHDQ